MHNASKYKVYNVTNNIFIKILKVNINTKSILYIGKKSSKKSENFMHLL